MSRYEIIIDGATLTQGGAFVRHSTVSQAIDEAWPYIKAGKRVILFDTWQLGHFDFWLCRDLHGGPAGVEVTGIERLNDTPKGSR